MYIVIIAILPVSVILLTRIVCCFVGVCVKPNKIYHHIVLYNCFLPVVSKHHSLLMFLLMSSS